VAVTRPVATPVIAVPAAAGAGAANSLTTPRKAGEKASDASAACRTWLAKVSAPSPVIDQPWLLSCAIALLQLKVVVASLDLVGQLLQCRRRLVDAAGLAGDGDIANDVKRRHGQAPSGSLK
jgi:hypothetical protein